MNKILENELGDMLEVYMNDIIVKLNEKTMHKSYLTNVFSHTRQYNMRLNLEKFTFVVKEDKLKRRKWMKVIGTISGKRS